MKTELGFYSLNELRVFNDNFTLFSKRENISESITVKKWKSDKNYFSSTKVVINLYINDSTSISLIYTFSLAENIIVYSQSQGTNREKYFNQIIYNGKNANYGGK